MSTEHVAGHVVEELQKALDGLLDRDHHGSALAMLMAKWLAPLPSESWLPMLSLQTQSIVAWAKAEQPGKRRRRKSKPKVTP